MLQSSVGANCARVATEVRQSFVQHRCDVELLGRLYSLYHPVPDPALFVARAVEMFPRLCCGVASVYLRHVLGEGRVVRGFYGDERHTFLLCGDLVVDITADQFGGPEVYVGPPAAPWRCPDPCG